MSGSIKVLQFFQKCHQSIGIQLFDPNEKSSSITVRRIIFLIGNAVYGLPTIAHSVFLAKEWFDYGMGFFIAISTGNSVVVYLLFIWQQENTLTFIKTCEEFIEKSKCLTFIKQSQ